MLLMSIGANGIEIRWMLMTLLQLVLPGPLILLDSSRPVIVTERIAMGLLLNARER